MQDPPRKTLTLKFRPATFYKPAPSQAFRVNDAVPVSSRETLEGIIGLAPGAALEVMRQAGYQLLICVEEGNNVIWTSDVVTGRVRALARDGVIVRIVSAHNRTPPGYRMAGTVMSGRTDEGS